MLDNKSLSFLNNGKNLLAFSAGVDSTALFFILLEADIPFDIAIVNYHMREQSQSEVSYAKELSERFDKLCFIYDADIKQSNFEASARHIRYNFFETLFKNRGYTNLITAHQLDDRLEWFLMQLSKGAGLHELFGLKSVDRWNSHLRIRPLLQHSKSTLLNYLRERDIKYFIDNSNHDEKYKRNFFRHKFASPLLSRYESGIRKSFNFLQEDIYSIDNENPTIKQIEEIFYFKTSDSRRITLLNIDKVLKKDGFLMRQGDKDRLKITNELVVGRRYSVSITPVFTLIVPYESAVMTKKFKEECRKLNITSLLRPYLFNHIEIFDRLKIDIKLL